MDRITLFHHIISRLFTQGKEYSEVQQIQCLQGMSCEERSENIKLHGQEGVQFKRDLGIVIH